MSLFLSVLSFYRTKYLFTLSCYYYQWFQLNSTSTYILKAIRLSLLVKKLSCHSCKFIGVYRLQNHFLWLQIEQELHIGGESQQVAITPNVIVSKLDEVLNAIFLRVFPDGRAFYVQYLNMAVKPSPLSNRGYERSEHPRSMNRPKGCTLKGALSNIPPNDAVGIKYS